MRFPGPLLCAGVLLAGSPAPAMPPSRCAAIETPERPGRPHVLVPTGLVPHSSPSRIAALAVGRVRDAVVPCRAAHPMVFIGDRARQILSAVGIGQVCRIRPYELLKGR